jgi:hypothetical protein
MELVVLQRNETVFLVESLRVIVFGEKVYRENADPLRHVTGRLQEVKEELLAESLPAARMIDGKPAQVRRRQWVSRQPGLVIRRKMIAEEAAGGRGVVGEDLPTGTADCDIDTAHATLMIGDCVLAEKGI